MKKLTQIKDDGGLIKNSSDQQPSPRRNLSKNKR